MIACDPHLLSLYLDGELTLPARVSLEGHLSGCSSCRDELAALRRIDADIAAWGSRREPVPSDAESRVLHSVSRRRRFGPLLKLSSVTPAAVGTSIAALLLFVGANSGVLSQRPSATAVAPLRHSAQRLQAPSDALLKARRMSAILFPEAQQAAQKIQTRFAVD